MCAGIFLAPPVVADVTFDVQGVNEQLAENIVNHNDVLRFGQAEALSERELDRIAADAEENARMALRPFGYYRPVISSRHYRPKGADPVVELRIDPGPAVIIESADIEVTGPGESHRDLRRWRADWPLSVGDRMDQVTWEQQKAAGLEAARSVGYRAAAYDAHEIALDLERNTASVRLHLDTGPRYVMGDIEYGDHVLRPGIVESIPRFERGDPYSNELMDDFRLDLWRSGYFTDVDVVEVEDADADPPEVDLRVDLATETRDTYQGALGYGTDTGFRLQGSWSRHPMSSRGDRVDVAAGWQDFNDEFAVRGTYRLPLVSRPREYWVVDAKISFENQDLELYRTDEDVNVLTIANGNVDERHVKAGWLKLFHSRAGAKQSSVQPFVQYLNSQRRYEPLDSLGGTFADDPEIEDLLRGTDNAFSVGVDFDVVTIMGQGFETSGYHDQAWIFASDRAFGSEIGFLQAYASTHRTWLFGDRLKLLMRGEIGYTDADVDVFDIDVDGVPLELSVTELPNFYRFKAGGSGSVRGYDFEQLSNNNVGSNNIVTGSTEIEYLVSNKWSVAAFADIGNAFNDWSQMDLKLGIGVGLRWYSIAGPIRLDVAQARDFEGQPWRVHITIGTPLL